MNYVALECLDRAYGYNTQIVEVFDQASVDLYGVRKDTSIKARAICDPALCGQVVAQLVLQRNLAYRNTYTFRLGWTFCLLEPMDLVAISDSYLGLVNQVVRITSVVEDQEGTLTFTAEDWFGAVGAPGTAPQMAAKQGFAATASDARTTRTRRRRPRRPSSSSRRRSCCRRRASPRRSSSSGWPHPGRSGAAPRSMPRSTTRASRRRAVLSAARRWASRPLDLAANGTSLTVDLSASGGVLNNNSPLAAANGVSLCALRYPGGRPRIPELHDRDPRFGQRLHPGRPLSRALRHAGRTTSRPGRSSSISAPADTMRRPCRRSMSATASGSRHRAST